VLNQGAKPNVTQHGPYVYKYIKKKINISYTLDPDNKELIQFKEWIWWEYQPDMTDDSLNPWVDKYPSFNLAFQAVANVLNNTLPENSLAKVRYTRLASRIHPYAVSDL
jgi:hypothetical protein